MSIEDTFTSSKFKNIRIMTENIGYKLRRQREDNGLSVSELSSASGIHPSIVELIEKGELVPSVATLVKLSRALGVRLGTFLDGMESSEPALTQSGDRVPRPTVNLSEGKGEDMEHLKFYALAQNKADRNMEPFVINVEYTAPDQPLSSHEGEEFIYVLEGPVEIRYGAETYTLGQGDSIYYDSVVPHCLTSVAPSQKAKVLAVVYTPF